VLELDLSHTPSFHVRVIIIVNSWSTFIFNINFTKGYTNSLFTITFEKENCTEWIVSQNFVSTSTPLNLHTIQAIEPAEVAQDIAKSVSNGIELTCNCTFPSDHITDRQLSCQNKNLTFRGRIISTLDRESTVLLEDFQTWLMSEPTVKAKSEQLKLARNRISYCRQ
jgi:hypothetical protein